MKIYSSFYVIVLILIINTLVSCGKEVTAFSQDRDSPQVEAAKPTPPESFKRLPPESQKEPSGLRSIVLKPGSGKARPQKYDSVSFTSSGRRWDNGQVFDHTPVSGRLRRIAVKDLFYGLAEGVRLMAVGEHRRFWIPAPLVRGGRYQLPMVDLIMDVTLVAIHPGTPPPEVPEDVAAIPKTANRTKSGLAYRTLQPGLGSERPTSESTVVIEFSAWTQKGVMFKSTYPKGPTKVRVSHLIPGWAEGLRRMRKGERTRLWIPESLAYNGQQGQPKGNLVIDLHLVDILDGV